MFENLLFKLYLLVLILNSTAWEHHFLTEEDIIKNKKYVPASRLFEDNPLLRRIGLFGDSMLKTPDKYFEMFDMIIEALKKRLNEVYPKDPKFGENFVIDISGMRKDGARMSDMKVVFANQVLEWQGRGMTFPKVALVYLSSDMADAHDIVRDNTGKSLKILLKSLFDEYRLSLTNLLNDMKLYNITQRIVMGPTAFEVR